MKKIDMSSIWKKEDWWACWVGFFILFLTFLGVVKGLGAFPSVKRWTDAPFAAFTGDILVGYLIMFIGLTIIYLIAISIIGESVRTYVPAFLIVFFIAIVAFWIANQKTLAYYGLAYPFWALIIGLIISNTVGVPKWMKVGVRTELYIKTGLVILGADILFGKILVLGPYGLVIAWVVTPIVLYFMYLYGVKTLKMEKELVVPIAAATSVCGVSAAIAAGAACKAKPVYITIAVGTTLIFTVLMMVVMPFIAKATGMSQLVAGAWLGGTIDSTGAVVAAGEMVGPTAMKAAATIKMIQNVLIGIIAFFIALIWVTRIERDPTAEKPSPWEIWFRTPKFIIGFVIASLVFSFLLTPIYGDAKVSEWLGRKGGVLPLRDILFCLAFVCIGLDSNYRELGKYLKGGKPFNLYWVGQLFNIFLTLLVCWLLLGGVLFAIPKF
ncbi:MAG: putative sulfate exporter family transporter [Thermodesulfobacteriota bacterium]|nr:putative sulfate exporter family transporter [Thermodesulfobacteriota bacterium]